MKRIGFVGVPGSGKSAVARGVAASAYNRIGKVELVGEYARRFLTKYGAVTDVFDQFRILQKQLEWEDIVPEKEIDVSITESPIHMGFLYVMEMRNPDDEKDTMYVNDIFKIMNKVNCPTRYDVIFHLPPLWLPSHDGVRPDNQFEENWRIESDSRIQFIFKLFPPKHFVTIQGTTLDARIEECLSFCEKVFKPNVDTPEVPTPSDFMQNKGEIMSLVKLNFSGYKSHIGGYSKLNGFEISLLNLDKFEEQFSKCFVMDKGDGINFVKHEIDMLSDKDKIRFLEILSQYGEKCDEDPGFGGDVEKEIKRMHRLT